jgi:hypothetical protein
MFNPPITAKFSTLLIIESPEMGGYKDARAKARPFILELLFREGKEKKKKKEQEPF